MRTYCCISALVIAALFPFTSHANTFCVSDASQLQSALTTAASNGQDDTIQIVQGNYVGSFIYASTEAYDLTVEGGYTDGCASRVVDPANTVIDANNLGTVIALNSTQSIDYVLEGLTLQNGLTTYNYDGAGLYANTPGGKIILNRCVLDSNQTDQMGGGAYLYGGTVTITASDFKNNIAGDSGGGAMVTANLGTATLINNTFSTIQHLLGEVLYLDLTVMK